jgi:hypothetical protein
MPEKRKRRPGAGRPPIDRRGSVIAQVRFSRDDWEAVTRLASKHRRDASKEIRAAVHHWIRRRERPDQHVGALTCLIEILVRRIEARTGRKWIEDPATGTFVREGIERLISHFALTPTEPVTVPPEIEGIPGELITIAENLYPHPGVPEVPSALLGDEWEVLALIVKDLGSGWQRNKDVWFGRKGDAS